MPNITSRPQGSALPRTQGTYLSQAGRGLAISVIMEQIEPPRSDEHESAATDLARRLARYRRRVEAEGRPRSVQLIDRAIEDAGGEGDSSQ